MTTHSEALEAVDKAARRMLSNMTIHRDWDVFLNEIIAEREELREALAALDTATDDGWRQDRPGWYWVIYDLPVDWEPAEWIPNEEIWLFTGSDMKVHTQNIDKIGPALPSPPATSEEG